MKRTQHQNDLIRRYLVWCYKTTKEDFDRIERYFTQLEVDTYVLKKMRSNKDYIKASKMHPYRTLIDQFEGYMKKKEAKVLKEKYSDKSFKKLQPHYQYLKSRLAALEGAIVHFLGKREKIRIRRLYEEEMTHRIMEARDH